MLRPTKPLALSLIGRIRTAGVSRRTCHGLSLVRVAPPRPAYAIPRPPATGNGRAIGRPGRLADGNATPAVGRRRPTDGRATPADGRATPADGREAFADGRAHST